MKTFLQRFEVIIRRIAHDFWQYRFALLSFALYYAFVHYFFHAFCPLYIITGFPCPGCGMSRAMVCILTFQFPRAWALHPMAFPAVLLLCWSCFRRYIMGRKVTGFRPFVAVLLVSMIVLYVYRMVTVFPGAPPISYGYRNILAQHFPFYKNILHKLLGV
jgi:hypothetical protein